MTAADGSPLGWLDLATGLPHRVPRPRRAEFDATLDEHYARRRRERRRITRDAPVPRPEPTSEAESAPSRSPRSPLEATPLGALAEPDEDADADADGDGEHTAAGHELLPVTPGTLVPGLNDAPLVPLALPRNDSEASSAGQLVDAPRPDELGKEGSSDLAANRAGQAAKAASRRLAAARPVATRLARLLGRETDASAFRRAARAERRVARALRPLVTPWWSSVHTPRHRWYVLHSIPAGTRGGTIDHLVIGPAGVFTVTTHARGRTRTIDADYISMTDADPASTPATKARADADHVRNLLDPHYRRSRTLPVVPLLVVTDPELAQRRATEDGVHVLAVSTLRRWLRRRGTILTNGQAQELYEAARMTTMWSE